MKVAFCDRDGTLIEDYPDQEWGNIKEPKFIKGVVETLLRLKKLGYKIIIITNQYLINEGYVTQKQYNKFNSSFLKSLNDFDVQVLDVFYCPHRRDEGCKCIKPNKGMIEKALNKYKTIKLEESFVVGNSKVDIDLARNLKIKSFGLRVDSDYSRNIRIEEIKDLLKFI